MTSALLDRPEITQEPWAKVIADSISPEGARVTTMECQFHRFVLAEFNTHRMFSRNSASSRAIPVEKQLAKVIANPAWPIVWAAEKPGMQGGNALTGTDFDMAEELLSDIWAYSVSRIETYLQDVPEKEHRLHKSLINRVLEPFMWHRVIVTSAEWENFFHQRCHKDAQPEIRAVAEKMQLAYEKSTPKPVGLSQFHLPYIDNTDWEWAREYVPNHYVTERDGIEGLGLVTSLLCMISTARCARVSYLTHDGVRDQIEDVKMYRKLVSGEIMHASPLEHICTPANVYASDPLESGSFGNLEGFVQLRHIVERQMRTGVVYG